MVQFPAVYTGMLPPPPALTRGGVACITKNARTLLSIGNSSGRLVFRRLGYDGCVSSAFWRALRLRLHSSFTFDISVVDGQSRFVRCAHALQAVRRLLSRRRA